MLSRVIQIMRIQIIQIYFLMFDRILFSSFVNQPQPSVNISLIVTANIGDDDRFLVQINFCRKDRADVMPDRVGVTQIELRVVPREAITRLSARQAARRRRQRYGACSTMFWSVARVNQLSWYVPNSTQGTPVVRMRGIAEGCSPSLTVNMLVHIAALHLSCNPVAKCSIVRNLQTHAKYFITKVPLVNVSVDLSISSILLVNGTVRDRARIYTFKIVTVSFFLFPFFI